MKDMVIEAAKRQRSEDKDERRRLQFDFSQEAYNRLIELREKAEARTNAELVRNALRLYEWFLDQTRGKGYKIQLAKDDEVKEVELMF